MARLSSSFLVLVFAMIGISEVTATGAIIASPASLTQCQPAALTWSNAEPPVYISAFEGTNPGGNTLVQFATQAQAEGTLTWKAVNITSGTVLTFEINDSTGVVNYSGQVTIKDGSNDCNPVTPSQAASDTSSGSTTGSTSTGSTPAKSNTSSGTTSATTSGAIASTISSPSTKNSTSSSSTPASTKTSTTTTTSGGAGMASTANTIVLGAAAAIAGLVLTAGIL